MTESELLAEEATDARIESLERSENDSIPGAAGPVASPQPVDSGGRPPAPAAGVGVLRPPRDGDRTWVSFRATVHSAVQSHWIVYNAARETFEREDGNDVGRVAGQQARP